MLCLARWTREVMNEMFHNINKENTFFEAIYFFISSLCWGEKKGKGKGEIIANVNSMICHISRQLCTLDTWHICILTIMTCNPITWLALNHLNIMECWCYPPDFIEYTFLQFPLQFILLLLLLLLFVHNDPWQEKSLPSNLNPWTQDVFKVTLSLWHNAFVYMTKIGTLHEIVY